VGKAGSVLGRLEQEFLLRAEFPRLTVRDQSIRDAAEGALNRLLIKKHRGFLLCLS
jgi:hypothetical protein